MEKINFGFIDQKLVSVIDDKLYFNGFEYHKIKSYYKKKNDKNNIIYFRCKNYRKDERNRVGFKRFCNSKIECNIDIVNGLNNQIYKLVSDHSNECYKLIKTDVESIDIINEWDEYVNKCYNYLESLNDAYDRNIILDNLKKIHSENKYTFRYDEKKIKKLLNQWQKNSIKYTKFTIFDKKNITIIFT